MNKVFILHDIEESKFDKIKNKFDANAVYFSANPSIKHCIGCFGCWTKTPGQCIIKDRGASLPQLWASSNQVIIISQLLYGGFSQSIKACVDRSLGYILPYFRIVNEEMHHQLRYNNQFSLTAHFYGESITTQEKEIARQLLNANATNYGAQENQAYFYNTIETIGETTL